MRTNALSHSRSHSAATPTLDSEVLVAGAYGIKSARSIGIPDDYLAAPTIFYNFAVRGRGGVQGVKV